MIKTETEKFFEGLKEDGQVNLDTMNVPEKSVPEKVDDPEKVPESIKNRQHKRLEQRLQAERESNIELAARLKVYEEFKQNVVKEMPIDSRLVKIFGNDTPEKVELAKHFTEILEEYKGSARTEAIKSLKEEMANERDEEDREVSSYESKIESGLEAIEDSFGVDITSDEATKTRKEFLDFVTKIAPKDEDGSPIELPDLVGAYEIYQSASKAPKNTRREEIASRSMQQSGQSIDQKAQVSDEEKWLVANGIVKPRKR